MTQRCDVDQVRVVGMNSHSCDVSAVPKADVSPRGAAVVRSVDTITMRHVDADLRLPGAGVESTRRRWGYREGADGCGLEVAVRYIAPVLPGIVRLPDPSGAGTEVEGEPVVGVASHRHHPPSAERADASPPHGAIDELLRGIQ